MTRRSWRAILGHGADIVTRYDTPVSLRQLFYRLVADESIPNTRAAYQTLSRVTARARRDRWFPALVDRGRQIFRPPSWAGPEDARGWLREVYRRDRTEGQEWQVWIGTEKVGQVELLRANFAELALPIVAVSGYASQTYVDEVRNGVRADGRQALLVYAGDFDPSGEDIERDFVARTSCWDHTVRVALKDDQVLAYDLPPQLGKATDPRASKFMARHGRLVQVELEALPPDVLLDLYRTAVAPFVDMSTYQAVLASERADVAEL